MRDFAGCFFEPWVGQEYGAGSQHLRLMLLGKSHYGDYIAPDARVFTSEVVKRYAVDGPTISYFTIAYRAATGKPIPGADERQAFWHSVAFYNYVQCYVGTGPRQRPTPSDWATGRLPFAKTIDELAPHCVLVLGRELLWHVQNDQALVRTRNADVFTYESPSGKRATVGGIKHPTGGFSYARWRPTVEAMFATALTCRDA